jgi:Flp pilus assembly protein TadG
VSSRRRSRRGQHGVAAVETALVLPIFFLFVLGLFEGGLWFRDDLTTGYTARDGIRVLTTLGSDLSADQSAIRAVYKAARPLQKGGQSIDLITIYRATCAGTAACTSASTPISSVSGIGSPTCTTAPGGMYAGVSGVCNVYRPRGGLTDVIVANNAYWGCTVSVPGTTPIDSSYCPSSRKAALSAYTNTGPDYIGIRIVVTHNSITGLLRTSRTLVSDIVYRIEAQQV